jgi:peptidyl-prolyl cis-trans isomerase A (cyclophilin A)
MFFKSKVIVFATILFVLLPLNAQSTVVRISTSLGIIEVDLFDQTTPETVNNFLSYVNTGAYDNVVVHRSVSGFILQSGGFEYNGQTNPGEVPLDEIEVGVAVVNEPLLSNLRGTIAMAKLSDSPDSATSQWFINLSNNSSNLDLQNSGFTVFGQVQGDSMQVVDEIAELSLVNLGGAFSVIPMQNYTDTDFNNDVVIFEDNLVIISNIIVTNTAVDSSSGLNPAQNISLDFNSNPNDFISPDSGGGAITWLGLFSLLILSLRKK